MLESILQATGILALAVGVVAVVLVAIIAFWLWRKWRILKKFLLGAMMGEPPMTIELEEVPEKDAGSWTKKTEAVALEKELRQFELIPGKFYDVEEMNVNLRVWHAPDNETSVVVYHHEGVGVWADIFLKYEHGSLTVSNAPTGGELERHPDRPAFFMKGASFAELTEKFFAEAAKADGNKTAVLIGPDNFVAEFESAYKQEMDWRASKGGVTEEEIRKVMENSDQQLSDEDFSQAVCKVKAQELQKYQDCCIEQLSRTTNLPVSEWQRCEGFMFIVGELVHAGAFVQSLCCDHDFTEETEAWLNEQVKEGRTSLEILKGLTHRLREGTELVHCGSVTEPLEADVYAIAPASKEAVLSV